MKVSQIYYYAEEDRRSGYKSTQKKIIKVKRSRRYSLSYNASFHRSPHLQKPTRVHNRYIKISNDHYFNKRFLTFSITGTRVSDSVLFYKAGDKLQMNIQSPISSYADSYHISCLNCIYPISLTQNELINFPADLTDSTIKDTNAILKKAKLKELSVTEMIDYTIYKNDFICLVIHKTFALDKREIDNKQTDTISTAILGLCTEEALNSYSDVVSKICLSIEDKIKKFNLNSNNAYKSKDQFKLSSDNIQYVKAGMQSAEIDTYSVPSDEFTKLDKEYYPFIDVDVLIDEFFKSEDKLLILHGEPGVGKSKLTAMISHELSNQRGVNVIIYSGKHHNNEAAWQCLEQEIESNNKSGEQTLIIIDDLEPAHMNRSDTSVESVNGINNFFTNLLTIMDGVISNGVKIIITTNYVLKSKLDAPLYRPGRLFDSLFIRPLTKDEALHLLKKSKVSKARLDKFKAMKQDEFTQAEVAQYISETNRKIEKTYYKETNKKTTSTKSGKVGFGV